MCDDDQPDEPERRDPGEIHVPTDPNDDGVQD
jgi:hypothetical protein